MSINWPNLEKAASGASGAMGHFVRTPTILRTFWAKYPNLFTEDGKRRVVDWELRLRFEEGGWGMEDLEFKIEDGGLWIEDRH